MKVSEIKAKITEYQQTGKRIFTTSSFQSHSLVLLHIIKKIRPKIPIYFINTGYLFPETVKFKDEIADLFELMVLDLKSATPKYLQKDLNGKLLYTSDPDHCCSINKTRPLETVLTAYDVWMSGIRADQNSTRSAMKLEQSAPHNTIRFHPMLDWDTKKIFNYLKQYNIPRHPLEGRGYVSIGCEPCTRKIDLEMQVREARWFGLNKVECGLHTDLIIKE